MAQTGLFNLSFPGAILYCDSIEKRTAIANYLSCKSNSIDIDISNFSIEKAIERSIYNTTYIHEGKHLHDHLVCPILFHNFVLKLTALFYSCHAILSWNHGIRPYKYIPLPFNKWLNLSQETKMQFVNENGISSSDVPMFSLRDAALLLRGEPVAEDDFTKSLLLGAIHYSEYWFNSTHRNSDGYNTDFSVISFAESSTFLQQCTEIARRYGKKGEAIVKQMTSHCFEQFQKLGKEKRENNRELSEKDYLGYARYATAFTAMFRYAVQNNIDSNYLYPFISYLLFWAMSPNEMKDSKEACAPRLRMEKFFNLDILGIDMGLNTNEKLFELFRNPLETYRLWDEYIGTSYIGTNINISSLSKVMNLDVASTPISFENTYKMFLQSLFHMTDNLYTVGFKEISDYMYNIGQAMLSMTKGFLDNPSMYLYPESYSKCIDEFVNVPFKIEFVNVEPLRSEVCKIQREGVSIVNGSIYGDTLNASNGPIKKTLDWRLYVAAEKNINFSDALYGDSELDMPGKTIKECLPGIKPWFFEEF